MSRLAGASPPTANLRGLDADKWQRGHVGPPVAVAWWQPDIATYSLPAGWRRSVRTARLRYAQRLGGTSPVLRKCNFVRCGADMASARWRIVLDQPSPAARPGRCVRGSCGARPLRQSYIKPHCPQCQPVSRKLLLWQPPLRALSGEGNRLYAKLPSLGTVAQPSALPGRCPAPYAPPSGSLVVVVALWHWSGASRSVLVSGLRPVMSCVPRPPLGLAAARHWPRAVCPSAPKGLPQSARLPKCFPFLTLNPERPPPCITTPSFTSNCPKTGFKVTSTPIS
jgi:hypothetical protein